MPRFLFLPAPRCDDKLPFGCWRAHHKNLEFTEESLVPLRDTLLQIMVERLLKGLDGRPITSSISRRRFIKATLFRITPMIPAGASLAEALRFFTEQMGFTTLWHTDSMAGIQRDGIEFNLVQNDVRAWADNASFSIAVSDLDALHAEYATIAANVGPLEMKPWGRREFHMILPSGVCFQFYQGEAEDGDEMNG